MPDITMPKLSDSMEVGKIVKWLVGPGDAVSSGQAIAEVESDKAVMELEAFRDGVVDEIVKPDGSEVPVGEVIARIGSKAGKPAPAPKPAEAKPQPDESGKKTAPEPEKPKSSSAPPAEQPGEAVRQAEKTAPEPRPLAPKPDEVVPSEVKPAPTGDGRVAVSPYARKRAAELGVEATSVKGTGPGGRIVAADIEMVPSQGKPAASHGSICDLDQELPEIVVTPDEADIEEASFRLKTQASAVTKAKHAIPHFYMTSGVEVTRLMALKQRLKERHKASVTHVIMLACLRAIEKHPNVNRSYDRGRFIKWKGVNLGLAVAADEGLTVAVLRDAHRLALPRLVAETRELVEKARAGKLSAAERRHPTFTVSNLGMYHVEHFEPVINFPSAITLGVSTPIPTPVVGPEGGVRVGNVMRITLSVDHRVLDGAAAAEFLGTLRGLLEEPEGLDVCL